jgi:hypothetical protein
LVIPKRLADGTLRYILLPHFVQQTSDIIGVKFKEIDIYVSVIPKSLS